MDKAIIAFFSGGKNLFVLLLLAQSILLREKLVQEASFFVEGAMHHASEAACLRFHEFCERDTAAERFQLFPLLIPWSKRSNPNNFVPEDFVCRERFKALNAWSVSKQQLSGRAAALQGTNPLCSLVLVCLPTGPVFPSCEICFLLCRACDLSVRLQLTQGSCSSAAVCSPKGSAGHV